MSRNKAIVHMSLNSVHHVKTCLPHSLIWRSLLHQWFFVFAVVATPLEEQYWGTHTAVSQNSAHRGQTSMVKGKLAHSVITHSAVFSKNHRLSPAFLPSYPFRTVSFSHKAICECRGEDVLKPIRIISSQKWKICIENSWTVPSNSLAFANNLVKLYLRCLSYRR